MIQIDLTSEETLLLTDLLEDCVTDLRMEISGTDREEYREMLKDREAAIKKLLHSLKEAAIQTTLQP